MKIESPPIPVGNPVISTQPEPATLANLYPKTRITRGSLSGPSHLVIATLLIAPATHLILRWLHGELPMGGVLGSLLMIAALPFMMRWQGYRCGYCQMYYCDDKIIVIQEGQWQMHFAWQEDLDRIVRNGLGYTFVLKNGRRFRMLHKDTGPQHRAALAGWHVKMENAAKSATPPSEPTAAA